MKNWNNYRQTEVYFPSKIIQRCIVMEEMARYCSYRSEGEYLDFEKLREPINSGS